MNTFNQKFAVIIGLLLFGQQAVLADVRSHSHRDREAPVKRWSTAPAPHQSRPDQRQRHDGARIAPHSTYRHYYKPGYRVKPLPYGASRIFHNRAEYFFYDGYFYRPSPSGYLIVDAPIGAIIASLPPLHHVVYWLGQTYFIVGNTFYRRHPRGYIVVPDPGYGYRR